MKFALMLVSLLLLSACASSHVLVGQAREPISAEQVRLYVDPPPRYETVALLEASNRGAINFTDQQRTNTVIARMKEEAAALGANGILLQGMGNQYAGSVGSGNAWASGNGAYGIGFSSAVMNRTGNGLAIFVPDGALGPVAPQMISSAPVEAPVSAPDAPLESTDLPRSGAAQPHVEPSSVPDQPYEPDPSKRCDACARIKFP